MFERFSDAARDAVVLAQDEARNLGAGHIGTEHLLLGLVAEGNGVAAVVLDQASITLDEARGDVEASAEPSVTPSAEDLPFTPAAKKALELALREALKLGHKVIDTEHVLLGVGADADSTASRILTSHGLTPARLRQAVVQQLSLRGARAVGPWQGTRARAPRAQNTTPAVAELYRRARELAGERPVSSADMLRALFASPNSQAAHALRSLGIDDATVERALGSTPVEGTSDDTHADVVARMTRIRTEDGGVLVEINDAKLAARLGEIAPDLTSRISDALEDLRERLWRESRESKPGSGATMEG